VNWDHVVIPTAFMKFGTTKKLHSSFGQNYIHLSKLGACRYGPIASIKFEKVRKASFKFG